MKTMKNTKTIQHGLRQRSVHRSALGGEDRMDEQQEMRTAWMKCEDRMVEERGQNGWSDESSVDESDKCMMCKEPSEWRMNEWMKNEWANEQMNEPMKNEWANEQMHKNNKDNVNDKLNN